MKNLFCLFLCCFLLFFNTSWGQEKSIEKPKIHVGYGLFMNYNLYSWYLQPYGRFHFSNSSGQVFNVLPGVGCSFWLGDIDRWLVSVEAGVEFLPFAYSIYYYSGMGALDFPILGKVQFPVAKQKSLWLMMHVGAGAQFSMTDIYARPSYVLRPYNNFFSTIIGEVGFHISAVGFKRQHIREVELFLRGGAAPNLAITVSVGLRLTLMNKIGK